MHHLQTATFGFLAKETIDELMQVMSLKINTGLAVVEHICRLSPLASEIWLKCQLEKGEAKKHQAREGTDDFAYDWWSTLDGDDDEVAGVVGDVGMETGVQDMLLFGGAANEMVAQDMPLLEDFGPHIPLENMASFEEMAWQDQQLFGDAGNLVAWQDLPLQTDLGDQVWQEMNSNGAGFQQGQQTIQPVGEFHPVQTVNEFQPIQPVDEWQPIQTVSEFHPMQPVGEFQHIQPVDEWQPIQPVGELQPIQPVGGFQPIQPVYHAESQQARQTIPPTRRWRAIQPKPDSNAENQVPSQATQSVARAREETAPQNSPPVGFAKAEIAWKNMPSTVAAERGEGGRYMPSYEEFRNRMAAQELKWVQDPKSVQESQATPDAGEEEAIENMRRRFRSRGRR